MATETITYGNNPAEYERVLRQNLSSDRHTIASLIDFSVQVAIEAEKLKIESDKYRQMAAKEISAGMRANQFLAMQTWDVEAIAKVLEQDFGMSGMANLLIKAKKKTNSRRASHAAKFSRTKPDDLDDNVTLPDLIGQIVWRNPDESAKELWPRLYGELDAIRLNPEETNSFSDIHKNYYSYGKNKRISFGQFSNLVSKVKKNSG